MKELSELKEALHEGNVADVVSQLESYVSLHKDSAEAYFLLGNAYRKMENWEMALNNYQIAMDMDPEGPASLAYNATIEVLEFFNKDMFNQ
ncbi:MAG: tetratricopeptide repeat protein [Paludibacteraceae bacterium]|nr:tetratricopeptide repeat protein [Paludibacteraceae bacterium]